MKLQIETDQGWSFTTDISSDQKVFRNSSRSRGTGKWVCQANLHPGDFIVIERMGSHAYRISRAAARDGETSFLSESHDSSESEDTA